MSASHEWKEWHLTSRGWIAGTEQWDFGQPEIVPPPNDRVLSRSYHERQSSSFSKVDRYCDTTWKHPDARLIDQLVAKFGGHPGPDLAKYRPSGIWN